LSRYVYRGALKSFWIGLLLIAIISGSACSNNNAKIPHRLQWWLQAINWEVQSRTNGLTGKGIVIAVIDTAIDSSHPDLQGKIIKQHIIGNIPEEDLGVEHGTAVAGVICAYPHDKEGVLGVAPGAEILSIVISGNTEAQLDPLIAGIEYAVTQKVDIINISAGIISDDTRLQSAVNDAYNAGIVVVAAAGNDLYGTKLYPAKYQNVISVDSVDPSGNKLYGDEEGSVLLPGGNIVTTYSSKYDEQKKYVSYSGTSMSAPILSGIIALVLEQDPSANNKDITNYFKNYQRSSFDVLKVLDDFKKMSG